MLMRLNKYIAECGVCSRRKADTLIVDGKVKVNEIVITDLGMKIDDKNDTVKVNNKLIKNIEKKVYIMLNKPSGYITTNDEQFDRNSTKDLKKENHIMITAIFR